ncbi:MAG: hypothetical protein QG597_1587 [Actinomycetota bacterium]|nr:hypothetical protein [Actinomycetota bacterium]
MTAAIPIALHPEHLRRRALASEPGNPWVTYYDGPTGFRVELSAATLDNWVAKAGNLLAEEYDIGPGSVVGVDLGCHWLSHVWTWAVWALGAAVATPDHSHRAEVIIAAADRPPAMAADALWLACPTDPMARPLGSHTPPPAIDVMADIHTNPDAIALPSPNPAALVIATAGGDLTGAQACEMAAALVPPPARRVLVRCGPADITELLATTLSAACHGGSTVLVAGAPAADQLARITRQEAVDADIWNHNTP